MNFVQIVKKKGLVLLIINVVILIATLTIFYFADKSNHFSDVFKGYSEVRTLDELNDSFNNNRYVTIYYSQLYSTDYYITDDDVIIANFVDFGFGEKGLIGLISKADTDAIFEGEKDKISGKLGYFDETNMEAYDNIVSDFVTQYGSSLGEENAQNVYLPYQFNSFDNVRPNDYVTLFVFAVVFLISLFFISKASRMLFMPMQYLSRKECDPIAGGEYEDVSYIYRTKNVTITDRYVTYETATNFKVYDISDVTWGYFVVTKLYSVIPVSRGMMLKTASRHSMSIPYTDGEVFRVLAEKNPEFVTGYTTENISSYKEKTKKGG
jgi:hypothetical protein